ncbi:hypothetical protein N338_09931, partial [Podiceps cristatus]
KKITNSTYFSKTTLSKYLQPERAREIQSLNEQIGPGEGWRKRGGSRTAFLCISVALVRPPPPQAALKRLRTY